MKTRAGAYINQPTGYKAYIPELLPPQNPELQLDMTLLSLLSQADQRLGKLNGLSSIIRDPDLFVYLYIRKEALLSSQIEGTQCSLEDVFEAEDESIEGSEVKDVSNYVAAMNDGLDRLKELPLSTRLLKELHAKLILGTRGEHKQPGELRTSQNWIGRPGANLNSVDFVPPPPDELARLLSNLENFIHEENSYPPLIKAALIHAQFETIHPFLDGNGRLGRLLITFALVSWGVLDKPLLYLSYFFKANRTEYYAKLMGIRFQGDWEGWIKFFLHGVIESSEMANLTALEIHKLHEHDRIKLHHDEGRGSFFLTRIFEVICRTPIVSIKDLQRLTGEESYTKVSRAVEKLKELEILSDLNSNRRNKKFVYLSYLHILRRDTIGKIG